MLRIFGVGLLALVAVFMLFLSAEPASVEAQSATWHKSLKTALAESKKTGKPILMEFR